MRITLTLIVLLVTSAAARAQLPNQQLGSPFDKFVEKSSVQWAAYVNDTVRFSAFNLTRLLIEKLAARQIKAGLPVGYGSADAQQIRFLNKEAIDTTIFHLGVDTVLVADPQDGAPNYFVRQRALPQLDTSHSLLTEITQILYVEDNRLRSYIPWITPMCPVTTSSGIYLGESGYFSTCFNERYEEKPGRNSNKIFLGSSQTLLRLDSADRRDNLKEMYGRNLLATLWPLISKGNFTLRNARNDSLLQPEALTTSLLDPGQYTVPVYDSAGNIVEYRALSDPLTPSHFSALFVHFNWYYVPKKNRVFNEITALDLLAPKYSSEARLPDPVKIVTLLF